MTEIIFNFHGIGEPHSGVDPAEVKYWLSLEAYCRALEAIKALQADTGYDLSLTFDDGNLSDLTLAVPELTKRDLKATFYVCSGRIGMAEYLDAAHLQEMMQAGMTIGSHGVDHVNLRLMSATGLEHEAQSSRRVLEDICQRPVDTFAIPFGSYDRRVLAALKRANYHRVFSSDGGQASPRSWMQARQTLQFDWQEGNAILRNAQAAPVPARLKRVLTTWYKSWR